jgi:hypothetical protein
LRLSYLQQKREKGAEVAATTKRIDRHNKVLVLLQKADNNPKRILNNHKIIKILTLVVAKREPKKIKKNLKLPMEGFISG